jgi:nucleoside-diphosphate-sugar epimerase
MHLLLATKEDGFATACAAVAEPLDRVSVLPGLPTRDQIDRERCDGVVVFVDGTGPASEAADAELLSACLAAVRGSWLPLLYVSSAWVLGDTLHRPASEDSDVDLRGPAGWRAGHEDVVMSAQHCGVESVALRPGLLYGRGVGDVLRSLRMAEATLGAVPYVEPGLAQVETTHVDDLARAVWAAARRRERLHAYLLTSDEALTWQQVARAVAGASRPTTPVSAAQARELGLDVGVLTLHSVCEAVHSRSSLGWTPEGEPLLA